jgi:hypothetical protein
LIGERSIENSDLDGETWTSDLLRSSLIPFRFVPLAELEQIDVKVDAELGKCCDLSQWKQGDLAPVVGKLLQLESLDERLVCGRASPHTYSLRVKVSDALVQDLYLDADVLDGVHSDLLPCGVLTAIQDVPLGLATVGYCMSLVLLDMEEYGEEYNNEYPTVELPTDIPCGETILYSPRYRLFWEKMTSRCDHIGVCRGMYSLSPSIRFRYDMGFKPRVAPEIDLRVFPFPWDYRCQGWGTHYYDVSTYHRKRKERENLAFKQVKALYEARWTIIELRK